LLQQVEKKNFETQRKWFDRVRNLDKGFNVTTMFTSVCELGEDQFIGTPFKPKEEIQLPRDIDCREWSGTLNSYFEKAFGNDDENFKTMNTIIEETSAVQGMEPRENLSDLVTFLLQQLFLQ
jgi:hypothetical protein